MVVASDMPIEELHLSLRTYLCLKRGDIDTVADLLALSAERIANALESSEGSLSELCEELNIHARRLTGDPTQDPLSACMHSADLGLSPEMQSRLMSLGIRTLGQLTEMPKADLSDLLGTSQTDAILARLWAYCVVRRRDREGASGPPWLDEQNRLDATMGAEAGETESVASPMEDPPALADAGDRGQHEDKLFRLYQYEVSRFPLLNRADEVLLAVRLARRREPRGSMQAKDNGAGSRVGGQVYVGEGEEARRELIESALAWVIHWAKYYEGRGLELMDLIQEGNMGLIRAADRYNYREGQRFTMYAWWWVRQAINRAIDEQCTPVRLGVHVQERVRRLKETYEELWEKMGRKPTLEETCVSLGVLTARDSLAIEAARSAGTPPDSSVRRKLSKAVAKVGRLAALACEPLSLDAKTCDQVAEKDGCVRGLLHPAGLTMEQARDCCLGDLIPWEQPDDPTDAVAREQLYAEVKRALGLLSRRERQTLELRFGLLDGKDRTLEEVTHILGITREGVRQREERALKRLKHPRVSGQLGEYLI